ncbi:MAG TPA: hypothetical protein VE684_16355 [Crenalkalicoccus sp.]|nr:hypothetical protein [Crenalkalicoccus sp.]
MQPRLIGVASGLVAALFCGLAWPQTDRPEGAPWRQEFAISSCRLATAGRNPYFVLEPGFRLMLEGGDTRLEITVLGETRVVAGNDTRVVEEREWKGGKLYEAARNYLAICNETNDIYYFGEEVEFYEGDRVVRRDGTWLAGVGENRPGLLMPGTPRPGMRYYQEVAPGVAMDKAEIESVSETCRTPAGTFPDCLRVREETPLEPGVTEYKYYAPGIGLVRDGELGLIRYGSTGNR